MNLNRKDLINLVDGSTFLGSGGGGMKSSGMKFVDEIGKYAETVELLTGELTKDQEEKLGCIICDIGASSKFDKKQAHALDRAFLGLSAAFSHLGMIEAFFPIETGPENTLAPFVLAAKYGLPVIDGDGAARAVPTLPLCTFSVNKPKHLTPVALASGRGDVLMVDAGSVKNFETLLRSLVQVHPFGSSASMALWPDKVKVLKRDSIDGTISRALYCGMLFEALRMNDQTAIKTVRDKVNTLQGYLIRRGTVIFKSLADDGGFSYDTTKIRTDDGEVITVIGQNENLLVFSDRSDGPIAMAPDSICYLSREMVPLSNSDIKPTTKPTKQYINIIGVCANDRLHHEKIIIGFDNHVQELRYNTRRSGTREEPKGLGDLVVELSKLK